MSRNDFTPLHDGMEPVGSGSTQEEEESGEKGRWLKPGYFGEGYFGEGQTRWAWKVQLTGGSPYKAKMRYEGVEVGVEGPNPPSAVADAAKKLVSRLRDEGDVREALRGLALTMEQIITECEEHEPAPEHIRWIKGKVQEARRTLRQDLLDTDEPGEGPAAINPPKCLSCREHHWPDQSCPPNDAAPDRPERQEGEPEREGVPWPEIEGFAALMADRMYANRHRGDSWRDATKRWLLGRLKEEVRELEGSLPGVAFTTQEEWKAVANEAADVGNFAMMIADRVLHHSGGDGLAADHPAPEEPERTYGLADARCGNPACQCADPAPEEGSERHQCVGCGSKTPHPVTTDRDLECNCGEKMVPLSESPWGDADPAPEEEPEAQLDVEGAMERVKVEYRRHARAERWEEAHTLHEAIQVLEAALADRPAPEGPDPGDLEWAEETVSEAIGEMVCGDRHVAPEDASEAWFDILRPYLRRLRASRPSSGDGEAVAGFLCENYCYACDGKWWSRTTVGGCYCPFCGEAETEFVRRVRAAPPEGEEVGDE